MAKDVMCGCGLCHAEVFPILTFVAHGWKAGDYPPMETAMTTAFCKTCADKMLIDSFLLPQGREIIAHTFGAAGKAMPDFSKAELKWAPLDHPFWQNMPAELKRGNTVQ